MINLILGVFVKLMLLEITTLKNNTFILCDCEGFEEELFDEISIENLNNVELLIECHD